MDNHAFKKCSQLSKAWKILAGRWLREKKDLKYKWKVCTRRWPELRTWAIWQRSRRLFCIWWKKKSRKTRFILPFHFWRFLAEDGVGTDDQLRDRRRRLGQKKFRTRNFRTIVPARVIVVFAEMLRRSDSGGRRGPEPEPSRQRGAGEAEAEKEVASHFPEGICEN